MTVDVNDVVFMLGYNVDVFFQVSPGDTGWDVFSLDYHVDGPISTVSALTRVVLIIVGNGTATMPLWYG